MAMTKDKKIAAWILAIVLILIVVVAGVANMTNRMQAPSQEEYRDLYLETMQAFDVDSDTATKVIGTTCDLTSEGSARIYVRIIEGKGGLPADVLPTMIRYGVPAFCPEKVDMFGFFE